MTTPAEFPKQADTLRLRAKPRPAARLNRKVLIVAAGAAGLLILSAVTLSLDPPRARVAGETEEIYNTAGQRAPEGLAGLPETYSGWQPAPDIPRLGAPQSGDLGGTIVAEEDRWGIARDWDAVPENGFRPSPEDEMVRVRRLAEAKLADQAGKAGVFFELSGRAGPVAALSLSAGLSGDGGLRPGLQTDSPIYNPHRLETPASPWQVMAGTLIPASLVTGIGSDLPGHVIAQVTQPVYDTVTGATLLIPQGARLLGRYEAEVSFGQERALVVWERIIFPDGSSLQMAEPGTDAAGAAGLSDRTDHHWDRVFAAAGLATLLGIGAEVGSGGEGDIERAIRQGASGTFNQAGQRAVERDLAIRPTIRIRPGAPVHVLVTRDLVLRPYRER